jgi:hypothetical protein
MKMLQKRLAFQFLYSINRIIMSGDAGAHGFSEVNTSYMRSFYERQVERHDGSIGQAALNISDPVHGFWFMHGYAHHLAEVGDVTTEVLKDEEGAIVMSFPERVPLDNPIGMAYLNIGFEIDGEETVDDDVRQSARSFWQDVAYMIKKLPELQAIGLDRVGRMLEVAKRAEIGILDPFLVPVEDDSKRAA